MLESFPSEMTTGIPNNTRWKIFLDFLEVHADEYEQIFIADTRDVIFQADVFAPFKDRTNWLCYATEADDIAGSKTGNRTNYNWLVSCFDKTVADKLADKKIICCGTLLGSSREITIFCRELWKILEHKTTEVFDQAVSNYLIYNKLLPIENAFESDVNGGEIFTSFLFNMHMPLGTRDGFILRGDGGIPAVVHQYDRNLAITEFVDKVFCDKNFSFDERFTDPHSIFEQVCCLMYSDKINDAARLCMNYLSDKPKVTAEVNLLTKLWSLTLRHPPTPTISFIELTVQNAVMNMNKLGKYHFEKVWAFLSHSLKTARAVDVNFKVFIANRLLRSAEEYFQAGNAPACLSSLDAVKALELPLQQNIYLFIAMANRVFGRKDAALEAYKKVLELS